MPLMAFFTANGDGLFFCKGAKLRPQQKNTNQVTDEMLKAFLDLPIIFN